MKQNQVPHVLIFPAPAQGHVNSMLILSELLCLSDIPVTFLNTEHYQRRLIRYADAEARFSSYPDFRFETIPDGLPDDHPRSIAQMKEIFQGIESVMKPSFRTLMFSNRFKSLNRPPITCVIIDGLIASSTINVCIELGIPAIAFRTASACCLWSFFSFQNLVDAGEIPFQDEAMDKLITSVPGMVGFLRSRDLPSSYRAKNVSDPFLKFSVSTTMDSVQASATILNTFDDLEGPVLSEIAKHFPKIYTIGPLHALLSARRPSSSSLNSSNSLWEEDKSCLTWLDSQPSKSVVYVSFGSLALVTRKQMLEFWYGLVNSGKRFLWVMRPDSISDEENSEIPAELTEATEKRGYMVGWSPQEEVLVHPSVGGFLTHSGWNSTLESIVAGVPMICFPHMGDQQINSRFVSEVWKIGLDMKDTCDRLIVERMVNDLMENKREELMGSANRLSSEAKKSVTKGGSSYCNLELLVDDIKSMNLAV